MHLFSPPWLHPPRVPWSPAGRRSSPRRREPGELNAEPERQNGKIHQNSKVFERPTAKYRKRNGCEATFQNGFQNCDVLISEHETHLGCHPKRKVFTNLSYWISCWHLIYHMLKLVVHDQLVGTGKVQTLWFQKVLLLLWVDPPVSDRGTNTSDLNSPKNATLRSGLLSWSGLASWK